MFVDGRVQKSDGPFTVLQPLLIEKRDDGGEDRGRGRRTPDTVHFSQVDGGEIETQGTDVREATAGVIENGLGVVGRVFGQVVAGGCVLPRGPLEDVGEAAAGVEGGGAVGVADRLLAAVDRCVEEGCGANGRDVWAVDLRTQSQEVYRSRKRMQNTMTNKRTGKEGENCVPY